MAFGGDCGGILGALWEDLRHMRVTLGSLWGYFGINLGSGWVSVGGFGLLDGHFAMIVESLWVYYGLPPLPPTSSTCRSSLVVRRSPLAVYNTYHGRRPAIASRQSAVGCRRSAVGCRLSVVWSRSSAVGGLVSLVSIEH